MRSHNHPLSRRTGASPEGMSPHFRANSIDREVADQAPECAIG